MVICKDPRAIPRAPLLPSARCGPIGWNLGKVRVAPFFAGRLSGGTLVASGEGSEDRIELAACSSVREGEGGVCCMERESSELRSHIFSEALGPRSNTGRSERPSFELNAEFRPRCERGGIKHHQNIDIASDHAEQRNVQVIRSGHECKNDPDRGQRAS